MEISHNLLTQFNSLPEGLLDCKAYELDKVLPGPSLIHIGGRLEKPLFVSVLLHGNEITGFNVIQKLLTKYRGKQLPRSLSFFIGNVEAAKSDLRHLENQADFNRVWPGTELQPCPESLMMQQVVDEMVSRSVFASIDIHNTTGSNPHYACINRMDNRFFHLAGLFSDIVVYFLTPVGVQSMAFAEYCPAVTLECGKPGYMRGEDHALEYLELCLSLNELSDKEITRRDINLYHTVALVKIRDEIHFSFTDPAADLKLIDKLDQMNFTEIGHGIHWGDVQTGDLPVLAKSEVGDDVSEEYFAIEDGKLISTKHVMPAMLTMDETILRQDCLCYLMEKLSLQA